MFWSREVAAPAIVLASLPFTLEDQMRAETMLLHRHGKPKWVSGDGDPNDARIALEASARHYLIGLKPFRPTLGAASVASLKEQLNHYLFQQVGLLLANAQKTLLDRADLFSKFSRFHDFRMILADYRLEVGRHLVAHDLLTPERVEAARKRATQAKERLTLLVETQRGMDEEPEAPEEVKASDAIEIGFSWPHHGLKINPQEFTTELHKTFERLEDFLALEFDVFRLLLNKRWAETEERLNTRPVVYERARRRAISREDSWAIQRMMKKQRLSEDQAWNIVRRERVQEGEKFERAVQQLIKRTPGLLVDNARARLHAQATEAEMQEDARILNAISNFEEPERKENEPVEAKTKPKKIELEPFTTLVDEKVRKLQLSLPTGENLPAPHKDEDEGLFHYYSLDLSEAARAEYEQDEKKAQEIDAQIQTLKDDPNSEQWMELAGLSQRLSLDDAQLIAAGLVDTSGLEAYHQRMILELNQLSAQWLATYHEEWDVEKDPRPTRNAAIALLEAWKYDELRIRHPTLEKGGDPFKDLRGRLEGWFDLNVTHSDAGELLQFPVTQATQMMVDEAILIESEKSRERILATAYSLIGAAKAEPKAVGLLRQSALQLVATPQQIQLLSQATPKDIPQIFSSSSSSPMELVPFVTPSETATTIALEVLRTQYEVKDQPLWLTTQSRFHNFTPQESKQLMERVLAPPPSSVKATRETRVAAISSRILDVAGVTALDQVATLGDRGSLQYEYDTEGFVADVDPNAPILLARRSQERSKQLREQQHDIDQRTHLRLLSQLPPSNLPLPSLSENDVNVGPKRKQLVERREFKEAPLRIGALIDDQIYDEDQTIASLELITKRKKLDPAQQGKLSPYDLGINMKQFSDVVSGTYTVLLGKTLKQVPNLLAQVGGTTDPSLGSWTSSKLATSYCKKAGGVYDRMDQPKNHFEVFVQPLWLLPSWAFMDLERKEWKQRSNDQWLKESLVAIEKTKKEPPVPSSEDLIRYLEEGERGAYQEAWVWIQQQSAIERLRIERQEQELEKKQQRAAPIAQYEIEQDWVEVDIARDTVDHLDLLNKNILKAFHQVIEERKKPPSKGHKKKAWVVPTASEADQRHHDILAWKVCVRIAMYPECEAWSPLESGELREHGEIADPELETLVYRRIIDRAHGNESTDSFARALREELIPLAWPREIRRADWLRSKRMTGFVENQEPDLDNPRRTALKPNALTRVARALAHFALIEIPKRIEEMVTFVRFSKKDFLGQKKWRATAPDSTQGDLRAWMSSPFDYGEALGKLAKDEYQRPADSKEMYRGDDELTTLALRWRQNPVRQPEDMPLNIRSMQDIVELENPLSAARGAALAESLVVVAAPVDASLVIPFEQPPTTPGATLWL